MILKKLSLPAAAGLLLFAIAARAAENRTADNSASSSLVVNCYDPGRDVVTRDLAAQCHGTVISDAEAQKVQDRRTSAILRGIAPPVSPAPAGTRLSRLGSAFFIDDTGKLLTNNHVVDGCTAMIVEPSIGAALPAKVLAVDAYHDLALMQVAVKSPAVASFRAHLLADPGAVVAAVGYPYQGLPPREPVATPGVLERASQNTPWGQRLVMKGDIEPGDSGGPLLDASGLVIGVMNAKVNTVALYRRTGRVISDVGLGIPSPDVLDFLKKNHAAYHLSTGGQPLAAAQILDGARPYMARAGCWK